MPMKKFQLLPFNTTCYLKLNGILYILYQIYLDDTSMIPIKCKTYQEVTKKRKLLTFIAWVSILSTYLQSAPPSLDEGHTAHLIGARSLLTVEYATIGVGSAVTSAPPIVLSVAKAALSFAGGLGAGPVRRGCNRVSKKLRTNCEAQGKGKGRVSQGYVT